MPKRSVRSYAIRKDVSDFENENGDIRLRTMWPEIAKKGFGMDGEVKLGKNDLEKLGHPDRIKVVIYSLDN